MTQKENPRNRVIKRPILSPRKINNVENRRPKMDLKSLSSKTSETTERDKVVINKTKNEDEKMPKDNRSEGLSRLMNSINMQKHKKEPREPVASAVNKLNDEPEASLESETTEKNSTNGLARGAHSLARQVTHKAVDGAQAFLGLRECRM